jgi:two-component system LytT family response regulator
MNWKVLIVDDELPARERLARIIEEIDTTGVVSFAKNGVEALALLGESNYDFVFLDVEMPELTGIDVLHLVPQRSFQVVFQTAFERYAVEAFSLSATDYLMKPYTRERVRKAWNRLLENANKVVAPDQIKSKMAAQRFYLENVLIRMPGRVRVVSVADITHFTSSEQGTLLWSEGVSFACDQTLSELESSLNPETFLRIHKSSIINMSCLRKLGTVRPLMACLADGTELRVSREREKIIHDRLRAMSGKAT